MPGLVTMQYCRLTPLLISRELIAMTRKMVLAVVIILSRPKGVVLQALLGLFVFVVFLALHAATFPYTNGAQPYGLELNSGRMLHA